MDSAKEGVNIDKKQRAASLAGGAALIAFGASKRSVGGGLLALLGAGLVYRGATGHCHVCEIIEAKKEDSEGAQLQAPEKPKEIPGHGGVLVTKSVTINKTPDELYAFWRDFTNLPQIMNHLESVEVLSETRSKWTAKAPAGTHVSWEAEIERDEPGRLIAWRSTEGSTVENSGSVRFTEASGGRGTEVKVALEYKPPGGAIGAAVAKLFGEEPQQQVDEDLKRFQQLMETGEIAENA